MDKYHKIVSTLLIVFSMSVIVPYRVLASDTDGLVEVKGFVIEKYFYDEVNDFYDNLHFRAKSGTIWSINHHFVPTRIGDEKYAFSMTAESTAGLNVLFFDGNHDWILNRCGIDTYDIADSYATVFAVGMSLSPWYYDNSDYIYKAVYVEGYAQSVSDVESKYMDALLNAGHCTDNDKKILVFTRLTRYDPYLCPGELVRWAPFDTFIND